MEAVSGVANVTPEQIDHLVQGIVVVIVALAVIAGVLLWIFKPKNVFGIQFGEEDKEHTNDIKLVHHRLFKFFTERLAPGGIQFDGSDKAVIMENFLRLKFQCICDDVKAFAEKMDRDSYEGLSRFPEIVKRAVEKYEDECKNLKTMTSAGVVRGVPCCMLRKFRKWHRRHESQFFTDTSDLLADRSIETKKERAWLLLDALFYALRETVYDGEQTLPMLNGDFDDEFAIMITTQTGCKDGCE